MTSRFSAISVGAALALSVGLAACGKTDATGSANTVTNTVIDGTQSNYATQLLGEWFCAGTESEGLILYGDMGSYFGSDQVPSISFAEDGTGYVSMYGEAVDFSWDMDGDDTVTMHMTIHDSSGEETGETRDTKATLDDGCLCVTLAFEDDAESDDAQSTMIMTRDGKLEGYPEIAFSAGEPITSVDSLVGTWSIRGMSLGDGLYAAGDLSAVGIGDIGELTLTFDEDGKAFSQSGTAVSFVSDDTGTYLVDEDTGINLQVLRLGDDIMVDFGAAFLGEDYAGQMLFLLSK